MDFQTQQAYTNNQSAVLLQGEVYPKTQAPIPIPVPIWHSRRILVCTVMFFCFLSMTFLRLSISYGVIGMISPHNVTYPNGTVKLEVDFEWDVHTWAKLLSNSVSAPLIAVLAIGTIKSFGGSISYTIYATMCGILVLLHPICLFNFDFDYILDLRWVLRVFEFLSYVSIAEIFSQWFPIQERCRLISFSYTGIYFGAAISGPLFQYFDHKLGWQSIFYITGSIVITSSLLCLIFVKNRPSQDRRVSPQELSHIRGPNNDRRPKGFALFSNIALCRPFWALCIAQFIYTWINSCFTSAIPLYLHDLSGRLGKSQEYALAAIVSLIARIFMLPIIGTFMDYWKITTRTTISRIHKMITTIVYFMAAALFVLFAFISNFTASVIIACIVQSILSIVGLIILISTVSIAPNNSNVIAGVSSIFIPLGEYASSKAFGFTIENFAVYGWKAWFVSESFASVLAAVTFLFGSSESQPWALQNNFQ